MTTISPPDLHAQERDEWVDHQEHRQEVASQARALIGRVQTIASEGSKSQQAAWREHIEALADLVCFAERPDFESDVGTAGSSPASSSAPLVPYCERGAAQQNCRV